MPDPEPLLRLSPNDAYCGMVVCFNRGCYRHSLLLATLLRQWLESSPDVRFFRRARIPVVLEIEGESRRRLEG